MANVSPFVHESSSIGPRPVLNRLLSALPADEFARTAETLRTVPMSLRLVLQPHEQPIDSVFFPNGGVCSTTTVMGDGSMVEVVTIGREGMVNVNALFGADASTGHTFVQVADAVTFAMPLAAFRLELSRNGAFRDVVERYAQAFLFQAMQATACNALHDVEHRCARWLLETGDRVGGPEFALSHEFLSIMLGVHRPTVSVALGTLQRAGFIQSRHGTIRLLDRQGLEQAACECYAAIRANFARLRL
jgi:CRP-like cAMP-binding protein